MSTVELNFDGIVGPTHNYAGLAPGNLASKRNRGAASSPRRAALQGLTKAKQLADLGIEQHVLPPLDRPNPCALRALGFTGTDAEVIATSGIEAPSLLSAVCSASAMWAANAATVSPSADTADAKVHLTPANLAFNLHRGFEAPSMTRVLRSIFADPSCFVVHDALPATPKLFDEGAANHSRITTRHAEPGIELFCFGQHATASDAPDRGAERYQPRQGEEASRAIARRHGVPAARARFVRQSPRAIDAGVFHNDVVCVGNEDVLFVHEAAYDNTAEVIADLNAAMHGELRAVVVTEAELGLDEVISSYLFNSQIVTIPGRDGLGRMVLVAPMETRDTPAAKAAIDRLLAEAPEVGGVAFVDVRESMRNGGGPACLRLRVTLTADERAALAGRTRLDDTLYRELTKWVNRHYRDELRPADLADPALLEESREALDALSALLGLGSLYAFQR
ncbi:MAG: N-succinylarginine dihydrolase [Planctomycetota bacterium]